MAIMVNLVYLLILAILMNLVILVIVVNLMALVNLVILVNLVLLVNFCEPADSREFYDLGLSVNSLHSCESEDCGESTDSEYGEPGNPGTW